MTDQVLEEVTAWRNRPLGAVYPLVFFDALKVKTRWCCRKAASAVTHFPGGVMGVI